MIAPSRPFPPRRAAVPWRRLLGTVGLLIAGSLQAQEPPAGQIEPAFQVFINAIEDITYNCVYRPSEREVVLGSMRALSQKLGPGYARYFPPTLPADRGQSLATFAQSIRAAAADPNAPAAGLTVQKLVDRALDSYCQTLDAYSSYTDADTARRMDQARKPDYVGVGVTVRRTDRGYFTSIFRGGPADLAGMRNRDELLEVNGLSTRSMTLLEVTDHLSGQPGSVAKLKVKHADGSTEDLEPRRENVISTPISVDQSGEMVRISLLRINERSYEDLRQALRTIGPGRSLCLDLRGCPGGDLRFSLRMAEFFLPEGTPIARLETNQERQNAVSRNATPYQPSRLVMLQDEGTASGAEILIAALRGFAPLRAETRGERTYGKGVTTQEIQVARGGKLVVADSKIFGPNDEFWEGQGLLPSTDAPVDEILRAAAAAPAPAAPVTVPGAQAMVRRISLPVLIGAAVAFFFFLGGAIAAVWFVVRRS